MRRTALATALVAAFGAVPALADPLPLPRVDYAITYNMQPGGQVMNMAHHAGIMRVDMTEQGQAMTGLMNLHTNKMTVLMSAPMKMAFEMNMNDPMPGMAGPAAGISPQQMMTEGDVTLTPIGTKTIAGHSCTYYDAVGTLGKDRAESKVCLTSDNVLLYSEAVDQGQTYILTATHVALGPQDPSQFRVPPGTQVMPMQMMMQGMGGLPGLNLQ
ncbi:hypothetical protein [Zavarzinia aquatilis]|uniref:DUF4412 domain-containing protein n=1 Tax=Zavarzinia aquatilis TaxID=2211142 RepID=A0A317DX95_9PROT|nr:hypothetical protein [Zavarzinia aquatilis]PWR18476.1 hypothetical protein DKG74_18820 [Zavarzinia aquatilis]